MEVEDNLIRTKYSLIIMSTIFLGYIAWVLMVFFESDFETIRFGNYIVVSILLYLIVYFMLKQVNFKKYIPILFVILGLYYIVFLPLFSPMDEIAHFDYILHIIQNHRLPTLYDLVNSNELFKVTGSQVPSNIQYEAVHPPLYYLLCAVIVFLFQKNLLISVLVLRLFGVFLIILTYYFTSKTYEELVRKNIMQQNDRLFYSIVLLFFLNPGFMTRMITISNEQLVVTLMTLTIYMIVKNLEKKPDFRQVVSLSVISAGMILTKVTSIYVIGVIVLLFLFHKEIKKLLSYLFLTLFLISPWLLFNFYHYKKITATSLHVDFVKKIVNPENVQLTLYYISQKLTVFWGSFWNPQESGFPSMKEPFYMITLLMNWLLVGAILVAMIYSINALRNISSNSNKLIILLSSSIILNILILCYGTITQDVDIMLGRYLYMNSISYIILIVISIQKIVVMKRQKLLSFFLLMMSCFLTINFMFDTAQSKQNLASKIKTNGPIRNISLVELIDSISFVNYQDRVYDSLLSNQDLSDIPSKFEQSDFEGVEVQNLIADKFQQLNNIILMDSNKLKITGNDPFLIVSLNNPLQTIENDIIKITLTDNVVKDRRGQLFWDDGEGFSEEKSIQFNIKKGSNSYTLPVGRNPDWISSKKVTKIRFDVDKFEKNEMFSLEEFELLKVTR